MNNENSKRLFYLDQNIIGSASEKNEKFKKISDIVYPDGNKMEEKFAITPFSLLEFSGATLSELFLKDFSLQKSSKYETLVPEAFDFYKKNIKEDFKSYFLRQLDERKEHKTTLLGELLINEYKNYINEARFEDEIIRTFSIDRISSLNYSKLKDDDIYEKLIASAIKILKQYPNINMVRLVFKSLECCIKNKPNEEVSKIYENCKFENSRDTVDTEIIHLTCFGYDGKTVKIITADDKEVIKGRVFCYKKILEYASTSNGIQLNFCTNFEIKCLDKDTFEIIDSISPVDIENLEKRK